MVIQGYDEFFKMYNKHNDEEITIEEEVSLLIATCFLFIGIFMTARISNDTPLKQIAASEVSLLVGLVEILIIYISNRMNEYSNVLEPSIFSF